MALQKIVNHFREVFPNEVELHSFAIKHVIAEISNILDNSDCFSGPGDTNVYIITEELYNIFSNIDGIDAQDWDEDYIWIVKPEHENLQLTQAYGY